jgi:hypothetical protein
MLTLFRNRTKAKDQPNRTDSRRAVLRVEQLEEYIAPSTVVYNNTFNWNGVASVVETVTLAHRDTPGNTCGTSTSPTCPSPVG